ncbi:benzoate/H(+) symporter BenE family transporter [Pseudomonas aeruginosa]|nr:benzoate/H(+) symporter BenE family transporter [Pseudomonas aeruginosa]
MHRSSAHEDPHKRYTAALWCGFFNCVAGTFGATLAALFAAFPRHWYCPSPPSPCSARS